MRIRGMLVGGLAVLALCLPAGEAVAAPGDLDPAFGNGGKSVIDLGGSEAVESLLLQPDGKVIVTGTSNAAEPGGDMIAARVLVPQGTLDPSYAGGFGWSTVNMGGTEGFGAGALAADGKIVLAGDTTPISDYGVARLLNPQGTFDPSFGVGGSRTGSLNPSDRAQAVAIQPDGRIVIAGAWGGPPPAGDDWLVGRLTSPQALPDGSFDGGGFTRLNFGGTADEAYDVLVQPDGKIVVAGTVRDQGAGYLFGAVARLTTAGTPDDSFGNLGRVTNLASFASALALQPDGKLIVVGSDLSRMTVSRLLPNGSFDEAFAGDGQSGVDFGPGFDAASDVIVQPDGKIIVVGGAETENQRQNMGAARLQPNGLLDTTFGNGGKMRIDFGAPTFSGNAEGVVQQADGKIILAGWPEDNIALARLDGDPPGGVKEKCRGKEATILGTNAKDKLKGTKKKDVVSAGGGRDTVKGLKGNDLICGGKGPDKLIGGPGKDTLLGEKGKDKLFGGPKKDKLLGGAAKDLLVGGAGPDKINGGPGKDSEKQ